MSALFELCLAHNNPASTAEEKKRAEDAWLRELSRATDDTFEPAPANEPRPLRQDEE